MSAAPGKAGTTRRFGWPATFVILVALWVVVLGLVIGIGAMITGPLKDSVGAADNDLARWFAEERTSPLNQAAELLSLLGDTRTELVLAPVIAVAMWLWQRNLRPALFVGLTTSGVGGIYILAADTVSRPRPPVKILDSGLDPTHSFPSGHVGTATALYGLIVVLVWTYARAARWWVSPALLLPLLVLVSRVYEGAHHLTDVLTSLVFASAWTLTTARLILSPQRGQPKG